MTCNTVYPIRDVSRMTGVKPVTLRPWQRRYGLIKPARTEKGHRLYSDTDIQTIRDILQLLEQGVSIGQVRFLLESKKVPLDQGSNWENECQRLMQTAIALKLSKLESLLQEMSKLYPCTLFLRNIIEPWLYAMAIQTRPDKELIERSSHIVLQRFIERILTLKKGKRFAVGILGMADNIKAILLQYELQGLECPSLYLGLIEPKQLAFANSRLGVDGWLLLLGTGLTPAWLESHQRYWPENTFFVGEMGQLYVEKKCLEHPYAATADELLGKSDKFARLVQPEDKIDNPYE